MGWGLREAPVAPVFVMKEQLRQELPPAATFQHFYLPGKWIFYMHRRRSRTSGPTNVFFFNFITFTFTFFSLLLSKWTFYMHRRRSWTSGPTNVFFNFITFTYLLTFFPLSLFPHLANVYLAHKAMMMIEGAVSWKRKTGFILQEGHQTPTALSS